MNHYQVLGVSSHATDNEIRMAYKQLALRYHPDRNQGSAESEELFKQINVAYQVLSDSSARAHYDLQLQYGQYQSTVSYSDPHTDNSSAQTESYTGSYTDYDQEREQRQSLIWVGSFIALVALIVIIFYLITNWNTNKTAQANELLFEKLRAYYASKNYSKTLYTLDSLTESGIYTQEMNVIRNNTIHALRTQTDSLYALGKYSEALHLFEPLLQVMKNNYEVNWKMAQCYMQIKNTTKAIEHLDVLIDGYKYELRAYHLKGQILIEQLNQPKAALSVYDSAVVEIVKEYRTTYGDAYFLLIGESTSPDIHFDIFCGRAKTYYQLNNLSRALSDCDWATNLRPRSPLPHVLKASFLFEKSKSEACNEWRKALQKGLKNKTLAEKYGYCF